MAAACLLVSLTGILVIDNDINAVHLARQKRLTTKQTGELETVSCSNTEICYTTTYSASDKKPKSSDYSSIVKKTGPRYLDDDDTSEAMTSSDIIAGLGGFLILCGPLVIFLIIGCVCCIKDECNNRKYEAQ